MLKSAKLQLLYAIVVYLPIEKRKEDNMETLFNELEEYLYSNTIQYTSDRKNYTVSFDGKTYELFLQMMMDISLMKIFGGTMKLPNMTAIFSASAAYGTL